MADELTTCFQFPATVRRASTADLLDLAKQRAPDAAAFDEHQPHFWRARISTNALDSYYTAMQASTLRNFAADAETGVAFQDSHKTDGLIRMLGQSITGKYTGPGGDGVAHTDADFYTLLGVSPTIDEFVARMRGGLVRDVSVGFYGGRWMCSICARDMMADWDCYHWPGMEYIATDEQGNKTDKKVLCTARIEDAHLSEVSAVYDGATPGAMILRAQRAIEAGQLRAEQARVLEVQYRTKLPTVASSYPGIDLQESQRMKPNKEEHVELPSSPSDGEGRVVELVSDTIRALFAEGGVPATDDLAAGVRHLVNERTRLTKECERLRPLADDGTAYRIDLIATAIAEGKRAFGADFAEETYQGLLQGATLETVKRMRDDWAAVGKKLFPGGRQTVDESERDVEQPDPATTDTNVPDAAYRVGR